MILSILKCDCKIFLGTFKPPSAARVKGLFYTIGTFVKLLVDSLVINSVVGVRA